MKYLILVTLSFFSLHAEAGKDRGGIHNEKLTKIEIEALLQGNALKTAMLSYLNTLPVNEIDTSTEMGAAFKATLVRVTENQALQLDILTPNNYESKDSCEDYNSLDSHASTVIGDIGGKICFNTALMAKDFLHLDGEELLVKVASIAFHEHIHHFQDSDVNIDSNEQEAYLFSAYIELTAKLGNSPVLLWTNPFTNFTSVCNRSVTAAILLQRATQKGSCSLITPEDLAKIRRLTLGGDLLSPLQAKDLQGLTNLEEIYFGYSHLSELPLGLFDGLSKLKTLNLTANKISVLPVGIFKDLKSLQSLHLNSNEIQDLSNTLFESLISLKTLDLSGNKITRLPDGIFDSSTSIQVIQLSANQIQDISKGVFESFKVNPETRIYLKSNPLNESSKKLLKSQLSEHIAL